MESAIKEFNSCILYFKNGQHVKIITNEDETLQDVIFRICGGSYVEGKRTFSTVAGVKTVVNSFLMYRTDEILGIELMYDAEEDFNKMGEEY